MAPHTDRQTFKNEDLVLKVSTNIDPSVWDEGRYEAFVDELCGNREYQKEAIRTVMRFLAGRKYRNLRELAKETFDNNPEMERRYGSWAGMDRHLQLPDQLSCSIDMATGTGKSYVLYGLAAILLAEGIEDVAIEFERAVSGDHTKFKTTIEHKTYSFDEVAEEMYRRLQSIDEESKDAEDPRDRTQYAKKFPFERCLEIVKASAKKARIKSGRIAEDNRQKILQALGPLRRKLAKRVVYTLTPNALLKLNTSVRQDVSASAAELRRGDKTVFLTPDCATTIPEEQKDFFDAVADPDGDYRAGCEHVPNAHDFKTPCNMAIADATPERKFIRQLCTRENAVAVDGWLKNAPQRFYAVEYA